MRPALKLNDIEQEHLQEVYDAAKTPREELPYTETYKELCQAFQDRTFKNAEPEQIFGAMLKYTRSGSHATVNEPIPVLDKEKIKLLKSALRKHGKAGKVLPYSSELDSALADFNKVAGLSLSQREFWLAIAKNQARPRTPPPRKKAKKEADEEEDGE